MRQPADYAIDAEPNLHAAQNTTEPRAFEIQLDQQRGCPSGAQGPCQIERRTCLSVTSYCTGDEDTPGIPPVPSKQLVRDGLIIRGCYGGPLIGNQQRGINASGCKLYDFSPSITDCHVQ